MRLQMRIVIPKGGGITKLLDDNPPTTVYQLGWGRIFELDPPSTSIGIRTPLRSPHFQARNVRPRPRPRGSWGDSGPVRDVERPATESFSRL